MDVEVSIKNYRCFPDSSPVSLTIGKGFIAFVGPNNAGKSSILKLFYELRNVWEMLAKPTNLFSLRKKQDSRDGNGWKSELLDLYDPTEIFCDRNNRPISIGFIFSRPSDCTLPYIESVHLKCTRPELMWSCTVNVEPNADRLNAVLATTEDGIWIDGQGSPLIDVPKRQIFFSALHRAIYIGPFRNAINVGATKYFDISVGTAFISTWNL